MATPEGTPPDVSLREHLEALIRDADRRYEQRADLQDKAVAAALASAQKAVDAALAAQDAAVSKAEKQAERWQANANEWREAMNDRESRFASAAMLEALEQRVRENSAPWRRTRRAWDRDGRISDSSSRWPPLS